MILWNVKRSRTHLACYTTSNWLDRLSKSTETSASTAHLRAIIWNMNFTRNNYVTTVSTGTSGHNSSTVSFPLVSNKIHPQCLTL
jgi:hypothetical protein